MLTAIAHAKSIFLILFAKRKMDVEAQPSGLIRYVFSNQMTANI